MSMDGFFVIISIIYKSIPYCVNVCICYQHLNTSYEINYFIKPSAVAEDLLYMGFTNIDGSGYP